MRRQKGMTTATSVHPLKLFIGLSPSAELAAWQKKWPEVAKGVSKRFSSCTPDATTQLRSLLSFVRSGHA
jgi:hypothetical protein